MSSLFYTISFASEVTRKGLRRIVLAERLNTDGIDIVERLRRGMMLHPTSC